MTTTSFRFQLHRNPTAVWIDRNPILLDGEPGVEETVDGPLLKIGDGTTAWVDLEYFGDATVAAVVAALLANADPSVNTFREVYDRFVADEATTAALDAAADALGTTVDALGTTVDGIDTRLAAVETSALLDSSLGVASGVAQLGADARLLLTELPLTIPDNLNALIGAGGTLHVDVTLGGWQLVDLRGDTVLAFDNAPAAKGVSFLLVVTQDATGGHLLTLPASVAWVGGVAPVLGTVAGAVTVMSFATSNAGGVWLGFAATLPTNVANGYALLDSGTLLAAALLGTNTPDATKVLRGDRTWRVIPNDILPWSMDGTLYVKAGAKRLYVESARTIVGVRFSVGTAPTGSTAIVDVNKNGTTIFTTQGNRPTVGIGANTSGLVTNMDVANLAAGDYVTVDVDVVGSTVPGADATVELFIRAD